ncbi:MAG: sulfotransferase [Thermoleophilia bacterium]|nr:sulfotransferase [Thermoleophilia bacterium]
MGPPLFVLGVRRSGTTLLRVMLDRHPELAIPDESYFIPQLAARHRGRLDPGAFEDDLRRLPALAAWGVAASDVRARLRPGATVADGIRAVYELYAARRGKRRWGDKTPLYMRYLPLLERLFPDARYVHLVRDGRDVALSFLSVPAGIMTESWGHPRDAGAFACQWRTEVLAARELGRRAGDRYLEVRYEALVADPPRELERICAHGALVYNSGMLDYAGTVDVSRKAHQQSLLRPPTPGLRDWRAAMAPGTVDAFESVAGDVLAGLGYTVSSPGRAGGPSPRARLALAAYAAKVGAWKASGAVLQRTPLWRRRHPPLAGGAGQDEGPSTPSNASRMPLSEK